MVRWGGDATSTYNWQLQTYNAANDYYFEDYAADGFSNGSDGDSAQFITDVIAAGSNPLMTMVMLPWVAQSPETSVSQGERGQLSLELFGCDSMGRSAAPINTTPMRETGIVFRDLRATHSPYGKSELMHISRCSISRGDDDPSEQRVSRPVGRRPCAAVLSAALRHFYDMDNEIEIWGSTHRRCSPQPFGI